MHLLLPAIIGHTSDRSAVLADDGFITASNSISRPRITTYGWKLLVEWKDGSVAWILLKDLKDVYPVQNR